MGLPLIAVLIIALKSQTDLDFQKDKTINIVSSAQPHLAGKVSVMTYNVENLFDSLDDPRKKDETYLAFDQKNNPKHVKACQKISRKQWRDECLYLDWNEGVVHQKMDQLARVVFEANSEGPDILILQEVENKNILNQFADKYLKKAGYQTKVLMEGKDIRGIDVAVLSRFSMSGKPKLHFIPFKQMNKKKKEDTRGILEVPLKLPDGKSLTVYANHFPAPYHSYTYRIQAFEYLNDIARASQTDYKIAAGDFNVPKEEDRKQNMIKRFVKSDWEVVHESCQGCKGTYYYPPKKEWSFLDMILVSSSCHVQSVSVIKDSWMVNAKGHPKSFQFRTGEGASDHLPIYTELSLK